MIKFIIVSLFWGNFGYADVSSSEVEFQNSTIYFQTMKSKAKLTFSDKLGSRNLKIQKCNKKLVDSFWGDLVKTVSTLQDSTPIKGRLPSSGAWIKYEGLQFRVLDFEPAIQFLNKVPNNSHVLFAESRRLCKRK